MLNVYYNNISRLAINSLADNEVQFQLKGSLQRQDDIDGG